MKTTKKEQEFIFKQNGAQSGGSMTVSEGSFFNTVCQSIHPAHLSGEQLPGCLESDLNSALSHNYLQWKKHKMDT